mmetsp:Transcript_19499/g.47811  ORF Transcript_19499/g.47811 Transcript_19499/m.47811 type:complete len:228 (+) Transcript_19499:436-1119(+)
MGFPAALAACKRGQGPKTQAQDNQKQPPGLHALRATGCEAAFKGSPGSVDQMGPVRGAAQGSAGAKTFSAVPALISASHRNSTRNCMQSKPPPAMQRVRDCSGAAISVDLLGPARGAVDAAAAQKTFWAVLARIRAQHMALLLELHVCQPAAAMPRAWNCSEWAVLGARLGPACSAVAAAAGAKTFRSVQALIRGSRPNLPAWISCNPTRAAMPRARDRHGMAGSRV